MASWPQAALKRDVDQLIQDFARVELTDRQVVVSRHERGNFAHGDFALEARELGADFDHHFGGVVAAIVGEVEQEADDVL